MSTTALWSRMFRVPTIFPGATGAICQPSPTPALVIAFVTSESDAGVGVTGACSIFITGAAVQATMRNRTAAGTLYFFKTLRIINVSLFVHVSDGRSEAAASSRRYSISFQRPVNRRNRAQREEFKRKT